jgi:hypothetical protein
VIDDNTDNSVPDATELTISIHALASIYPRTGHTMKIIVDINGAHLLALLDSGSSHNFVDVEAAAYAGILIIA